LRQAQAGVVPQVFTRGTAPAFLALGIAVLFRIALRIWYSMAFFVARFSKL
jgi:hypothetical protein